MDLIKSLLPQTLEKSSYQSVGVLIVSALATYCVVDAYRRTTSVDEKATYTKVPIPKGRVPYFGHLFSITDIPSVQMAKWQKELGPAMYVDIGVKRWLIIGDPYLAHEMLSVHGGITSDRPFGTFTHKYYAKNRGIAFCNPSIQWSRTRGAVIRIFGPKNSSTIRDVVEYESSALITSMLEISERDGQIDLMQSVKLAATNVPLFLGVGKRAVSFDDPIFQGLERMRDEGMAFSSPLKDLKTFLPLFSILDYLFHHREMNNFVREKFYPFCDPLIQDALEGEAHCLIKELDQLGHMDNETLISTMADTVLAGSQTSAYAMLWIIVILCCHSNVQELLQKEVDTFITVHKRLPTFDDRDSLPYSVSVLKECMRYRSISAFGSPHETREDLHCRGYFIPKGTSILPNMQAMHMNPDIYNAPENFIPDRFLHQLKPMHVAAHAPVRERDVFIYGWGRRICPLAFMSEMQMFSVLIHLSAKCIIKPVIGQGQEPVYPDLEKRIYDGLAVGPKEVKCQILRRDDALL